MPAPPRLAARAVLAAALVASAMLCPVPVAAQAIATAYVPLDDNLYVFVDALMARGRLATLSRLERPYRVAELRRALKADTTTPRAAVAALLGQLDAAMAKYDPSWIQPERGEALRIVVTPTVFATAQTSGRRELMLADSTTRVRPGFGGVGIVQFGRFVAGTRAYQDPRLKDDPEFIGQKNRAYVGRMEDAYVSAQFRYGELFFGRLARNWGPPQLDGLLLGHAAYTYDHAYVRLGVPTLRVSSVVTRLDDETRVRAGVLDSARRYFSIHQLALRVGGFEAAASEAVVYGGPTENFRLNYVNPITPFILSEVLEEAPGNITFGLDLAYRSRWGMFAAQGMLDDVAKDKCGPSCEKPNSFGFTLGAEGVPLAGAQRAFASYTMVSNLSYRNVEWYNDYTNQRVGLGRGYADYDEARLGLDLLMPWGSPIRPYVAYRRQGEGDYRLPHPTVDEYPETRQFLQGLVRHTTRAAVSGAASVARYVHVSGDIGVNHVTNANGVPGATATELEGRVRFTIDSPWILAAALRADD